MIYKKPRLVKVVWEDTWNWSGWKNPDDVKEKLEVDTIAVSVGYLLGRNKKRILMTSGMTNDPIFEDIKTIPMGCVIKIIPLREKK